MLYSSTESKEYDFHVINVLPDGLLSHAQENFPYPTNVN